MTLRSVVYSLYIMDVIIACPQTSYGSHSHVSHPCSRGEVQSPGKKYIELANLYAGHLTVTFHSVNDSPIFPACMLVTSLKFL